MDINNALDMAYGGQLPDSGRWMLTRSYLRTLKIAIEWNRGKGAVSDGGDDPVIRERCTEIENEVIAAYRDVSHAEGLYWM
ncbi:hypothetical protein AB0O07_30210 [Streptomyces sp. NPDC093085]|uniref:hypothetical protein n=1 Tax=Streptomyces sp. NPDC093085 TaxID=3155068 RepID=UPI003436CFDD